MQRFVIKLAAFALVLNLGLHWFVLQTIAWGSMLVTYSQTATLTEAVEKTFNGKNPCSICKLVQEGNAEQQKEQKTQLNSITGLELGTVWADNTFIFEGTMLPPPSLTPLYRSRSDAPPTPRPKFLS